MNCNRAELSFSARYDDSLGATERAAFEAHLSDCAACRSGFAEFVRALADLKKLKPGPTSRQHVADVMARIDLDAARATPAPISFQWRRVASHFVAAAIGAAACFLLLQRASTSTESSDSRDTDRAPRTDHSVADNDSGSGAQASPSPFIAPQVAETQSRPVRFVGNETSLERNDRLEPIADGFTMKPGETLRTLPSQRVELSVDETGQLFFKIETTHVPDPPRAINEVHFVELPALVAVDQAFVDHAVDTLQNSVSDQFKDLDLRNSVRSLVERFETSVAAAQAANVAADAASSSASENETMHAPDRAFAAATFIASDSPVTIQRSGDRSALSVQGSIARVVPDLIDLLDNEDSEIADLAAAKLDFVRHDLEKDPTIGPKLIALPPETERVPRERGSKLSDLLHNRFGQDDTVERRLTPAERWRRWWQSNAILIATGSASST